jgi:hypothetical protein
VVIFLLRISHHRRFTANHTWHLDWGRQRLFIKANPYHDQARQEHAGHARIRTAYPVPELRRVHRISRWTILIYDRWPHLGPNSGLLLDEITHADLTGDMCCLDTCLTEVLTHYQRVITRTVRSTTFAKTITKLYGDRTAAHGRLDRYYRTDAPWLVTDDGSELRPSDLAATALVVNQREHTLDFADLLRSLRAQFAAHDPVWAALTQGDPTDLNIAWSPAGGPLWFDYDTGGLNALPGEFACFLTYQRLHGAWLTPHYNPAAFRDHPCALQLAVLAEPTVRIEHHKHRLTIDYRHTPSPARRHVLRRYLDEIVHPFADHLGIDDVMGWLRPYLVMRLLGVYNLADLTPSGTALSLALLAQALDPATTLPDFLTLAPSRQKAS